MTRVLILTKNLLAEQELQYSLQRLNKEVYCSLAPLEQLNAHSEMIHYFSAVIFSDTISNLELSKQLPVIKGLGLILIRKGNKSELKHTEYEWMIHQIDDWIEEKMAPSEITELIARISSWLALPERKLFSLPSVNESETEEYPPINFLQFINGLSKHERFFLYQVYKADGEIISREKLSQAIWEVESTPSILSRLSILSKQVRRKMVRAGFTENGIQTVWGKGYRLSQQMMAFLKENAFELSV